MFVKQKSFIAALCLTVCLVTFPATQAMAAAPDEGGSDLIMPLMEYIYDADYDFVISNGNATMYAIVRGHSAKATRCGVTVELQEKGLIFWNTVESWTSTEYGRSAEIDASYAVTAGKSYRMVTTVTVWSGTSSETQTMTSGVLEA